MGQIFNKPTNNQKYNELHLKLKQITLKQIFESIEVIHYSYPHSLYLKYEDFEDIFGCIMDMDRELFQILAEYNSIEEVLKVSTYEALACLGAFCGETYESKCSFMFRLFDFDSSNNIEPQEMTVILQYVCKSLCKISNIEIPPVQVLSDISSLCFQSMNQDGNDCVDYEEFYIWTSQNEQLQEFLFKYSGTQTYWYAKKRMNILMQQAEEQFISESVKVGYDGNYMPLNRYLIQLIERMNASSSSELVFDFYKMMFNFQSKLQSLRQNLAMSITYEQLIEIYTKQQVQDTLNSMLICRLDYLDLMRSWICFDVSDLGNGTVSTRDMKVLIWTLNDIEPDYFQTNYAVHEIDPNKYGIINKQQWLNFLCIKENVTKIPLYKGIVQKIFETNDKEYRGIIQTYQLNDMVKSIFTHQLNQFKDIRSVEFVHNIILQIVKEIQTALNENGQKELNWIQFHDILEQFIQKQKYLSDLLKNIQINK